MKPLDELLKSGYSSKIFAHTSKEKDSETLITHSQKTLEYCNFLIEKLSLEKNLQNMLAKLIPAESIPSFLDLIRSIVCHHDLGKINPVFQKEKMRNNLLDMTTEKLDSTHSFYGKILFDVLFNEEFENELKRLNVTDMNDSMFLFFLLSQTIDRHHTLLKDIDSLALKVQEDEVKQQLKELDQIAKQLLIDWPEFPSDGLYDVYKFKGEYCNYEFFKEDDQEHLEKREALFYLYKTVYSLLILSDYYATLDYVQNISYSDKISVITPELKGKVQRNFYEFKYNKRLTDKKYCNKLLNSDISEFTELNKLRSRILLESDSQLEKILKEQSEKRIFYLNIPTGGGKTNVSLKLALTLLKSRNDIKRIFYVFPFINIIEQNRDVIKETLGLDKELSSVYSSSSWNMESEKNDERLQFVLDNEFLNYPFVVMSNVNFFNAFIKSGKNSNYRLVNLANSIVIMDEIQSLNDKDWTLFNDLITYGSKYLGIYFIIMSATLPQLNDLSDSKISNIVSDLIVESGVYFNHFLFKNRVSIEYRDDVNDLDGIVKLLDDANKEKALEKVLLVVNTIQNSLDLYNKIKEKVSDGFSVYLLNSTILPHRRQDIIKKMKVKDEKIILVSTQSVEAGVDIDCDFGIRDLSIFDSIEQIAGRINRNYKDPPITAKLIIVNLYDEEPKKRIANYIYENSYRWKTIMDEYPPESIKVFLRERNFDEFYEKVLDKINDRNNDRKRANSLDDVKKGIRSLDFEALNKMDVIKQNSISAIVDSEISDEEFKNAEKDFLSSVGIFYQDKISGGLVWEKYGEFNKNFQKGYVDKKINTKIWSSVLSKFQINIDDYFLKKQNSSNGEDHHKGMPLIPKDLYSHEEGLNKKLLDPSRLRFYDNSII